MTRREELNADAPGLRLDQFLALRLAHISRGHWKRLIEGGHVTVDGHRCGADYKLKGGESVVVRHPQSAWDETAHFEDWVLHEDKHLCVINKPAGLLMHPLGSSWLRDPQAALAEEEANLAGIIQAARPALTRVWRCGIVHRLDRQTSGVLLIAKSSQAQEKLLDDFKERRVRKRYRAIVRGAPASRSGRVEAPIGRKPGHRRVLVTPFGKAAETSFAVLETTGCAAIVEALPLTGRTHQIRAHLALMGHPVAGDIEFDRRVQGQAWPPRMLLHAYEIELAHPITGKAAKFQAPLPADFREFWKLCGRPTRGPKGP